jgi:hypothetical protein
MTGHLCVCALYIGSQEVGGGTPSLHCKILCITRFSEYTVQLGWKQSEPVVSIGLVHFCPISLYFDGIWIIFTLYLLKTLQQQDIKVQWYNWWWHKDASPDMWCCSFPRTHPSQEFNGYLSPTCDVAAFLLLFFNILYNSPPVW